MKTQRYFAPDGTEIEPAGPNCFYIDRLVNDPSPSEIADRAALIRAGWTEKERYYRSRFLGVNGQPLLTKTVDTQGVEEEARAALERRLAAVRRHLEVCGWHEQPGA